MKGAGKGFHFEERARDRRVGERERSGSCCCVFCFNDPATTEFYTLSLHDALPIWTVCSVQCAVGSVQCAVVSVQCAVDSVQCAVCSG